MYDRNLIYWFKSQIDAMVDSTIDKSKIRDSDRFFKIFANKKSKILMDFDFTELTIPKEYISLTDSQKASIRELFTVWHDNIFYEDYLRLICRVGFCYERAEMTDKPEYSAILANYQFLKQLWKEAYPTEFNEFEMEKLHTTKTETNQPVRPSCPICQSNDVVSNGICWFCKSCCKQFLKNPKRKPNNQ